MLAATADRNMGHVAAAGILGARQQQNRGESREGGLLLPADILAGEQLRMTVHHGLQNIGLVSAFMAALSGQIYNDQPAEALCFGEDARKVIVVLQWMAMGCFFFTTSVSVVLALDIDGVPGRLLPRHLENTRVIFMVPYISMLAGVGMMATGYGIDVGERNGCLWSWVGFCAAPCFLLAVLSIAYWARQKRRQLSSSDYSLPHHPARLSARSSPATLAFTTVMDVEDIDAEQHAHPFSPPAPVWNSDATERGVTHATPTREPARVRGDDLVYDHKLVLGSSWFTPYIDRVPPHDWLQRT